MLYIYYIILNWISTVVDKSVDSYSRLLLIIRQHFFFAICNRDHESKGIHASRPSNRPRVTTARSQTIGKILDAWESIPLPLESFEK